MPRRGPERWAPAGRSRSGPKWGARRGPRRHAGSRTRLCAPGTGTGSPARPHSPQAPRGGLAPPASPRPRPRPRCQECRGRRPIQPARRHRSLRSVNGPGDRNRSLGKNHPTNPINKPPPPPTQPPTWSQVLPFLPLPPQKPRLGHCPRAPQISPLNSRWRVDQNVWLPVFWIRRYTSQLVLPSTTGLKPPPSSIGLRGARAASALWVEGSDAGTTGVSLISGSNGSKGSASSGEVSATVDPTAPSEMLTLVLSMLLKSMEAAAGSERLKAC